jgi:hypothetical protein
VVQHLHVLDDGEEDIKFIGVYSSEGAAHQAVGRLRLKPGFREIPDGLSIDLYPLDEDNWEQGFVIVPHVAEDAADDKKRLGSG